MERKMFLGKKSLLDLVIDLRTLLVLALLVTFFSITSPTFLTVNSWILIVKHVAQFSFIGLGMTLVILTGGIDLSVGSVAGLCGMVAGFLINRGVYIPFIKGTVFLSIPLVFLICLIVGAFVGFINGILIGRLQIPPFIATLGTMYICRGFALLISDGHTFPNLQGRMDLNNQGFEILGTKAFLGIPVQIWVMVGFTILSTYILNKTVVGHHIYAVGGNAEAARISGVNVKRTLLFTYMYSGICACICGLIAASQLLASHPATGEAWEMTAIAATVLGGTSMSGGIGKIGGTVIGMFVITVLRDGMVMIGISDFWQKVFTGLIVIIAVLFDLYQEKLKDRISYRKVLLQEKTEKDRRE